MALLIKSLTGRYIISEVHPLYNRGVMCFAPDAKTTEIDAYAAEILTHGYPLKVGEAMALRRANTAHSFVVKPGWYAADADGTIHYFDRQPSRLEGQWYITEGVTEIAPREALEAALQRVPEPTDDQPVHYGSRQAHCTPFIGRDVLPAAASARLLNCGMKPVKQLGFILSNRHRTSGLLTVNAAAVFANCKGYTYQPALTFEDVLLELLKYGDVRFERLDDDRVMVAMNRNRSLFPAPSALQAVYGALMYAMVAMEKETR